MSSEFGSSPAERASTRVGSTLLKWKLDALLGVGGMAAVYAATHHNRSRVALKVLHRELAMSPEACARFLREAYVANTVGHEGAVQVLDDVRTEEGEPVLVMQLLEGWPLDALQAKRGVLTPEEALGYADQILSVLAAAHEKNIVHRDIKPQNVFVTTTGAVKVLDFGVARLFEGDATLTATGVLVGTPAFMSPEQAGGRTADIGPPTDLWAVGATVFNLLTGRFVHEAENVQQHTIRAAVQHARSLGTLRPDLPKPVIEWVDKALAFDIPRRFRTAKEMKAAIPRALAGSSSGRGSLSGAERVSVPSLPVPMSPPVSGGPGPGAAEVAGSAQGPGDGSELAAIAKAHGLPPPAPDQSLTTAQKGIIAGLVVFSVMLILIVGYALASRQKKPENEPEPRAAPSTPLSVLVGSHGAGGAPPAEEPPPQNTVSEQPSSAANGFDNAAAKAALDAAEAEVRKCAKRDGPKGRVSVEVTFYPDGQTAAQVELSFGHSQVGKCVEEAFVRKARVKPFEGSAVTVTRMVTVPR